jgi:hypothetical protein
MSSFILKVNDDITAFSKLQKKRRLRDKIGTYISELL